MSLAGSQSCFVTQVIAAVVSVKVRPCLGSFLYSDFNREFLTAFETGFAEEFVDSFQTD